MEFHISLMDMNRVRAGLFGMVASVLLLAVATHLLWLVTLVACGLFTGWNYGKRVIPADEPV